jgi:hypothetical protein
VNDQPHVHQVTIDSCGRIEYGDQYKYIALMSGGHFRRPLEPDWYLKWRVRRIIVKLIRKHDKASQRKQAEQIVRDIAAEMQPRGTGWGSLAAFEPVSQRIAQ